MQKDAVQVDQVVAEKDAMQAQLVQHQSVQDDLFSRWREQQDRINALQEQNRKMHESHLRKLNEMQGMINGVSSERDGFVEELELQREDLVELKRKLADTEARRFELETQIGTDHASSSTTTLEIQLRSMKKQLLLWEENRRFVEHERAQLTEMREKLSLQDALLTTAHRAQEAATTKTAYVYPCCAFFSS